MARAWKWHGWGWVGTRSWAGSSAFSAVQSPVSDMELMFELEIQSADAKAVDVDDLPEQPPPEPALDDGDSDDGEFYEGKVFFVFYFG